MALRQPILALCLAVSLLAQQQPPAAPPVEPAKPVVMKKKGGKKKWVILAAVAVGVTVALVAVNARLGNEGKGIF